VIRGRVIAGDTGEPLRRARLVLSAPALDKSRFAATDAQGRYEFRDLPASRFVLTASKTGFVTLQLGQRRAFEPGTPFDLADKQLLEAVDIALPRGAVIAGRVTDDLGEPVPGVRVSAKRLRYQAGSRQPVAVGRSVETDDRGEYRLFGLAPGSYYIGVSSALFGETLTFGSAYYPGTSSPAEAEQITIKLGQTRGGVDVSLPLARLVHLSGVVVDARGSPLVDATVRALSAGATASYGGVVRADGTFTIAGVPQGEYSLTASGRNAETSRSDYGVIAVSALSGDVAGLVITTTAGSRLTGRITFDGDSTPPFAPTAISLLAEPVNARSSAGGPVGTIRGDWSFELTGPRRLLPAVRR